jgi:hypothetical protein
VTIELGARPDERKGLNYDASKYSDPIGGKAEYLECDVQRTPRRSSDVAVKILL